MTMNTATFSSLHNAMKARGNSFTLHRLSPSFGWVVIGRHGHHGAYCEIRLVQDVLARWAEVA